VITIVRLLDYQANQPLGTVIAKAIIIPNTPVTLATLSIAIPKRAALKNRVELLATTGIRGDKGIARIKFKIRHVKVRNVVTAIQEIRSSKKGSDVVTLQGIDFDIPSGIHRYVLTAENIARGTAAEVVGPISFSALAVSSKE
jgi:hypothetical protein